MSTLPDVPDTGEGSEKDSDFWGLATGVSSLAF